MKKNETKGVLDKAAILAFANNAALKVEKIELPEMGGEVYIKELTAGEREALEKQMQSQTDKNAVRATVFVHSVCNADGELMFDVEDIEAIKQLPSRPVIKVFNRSNEINGITPEQVDTAEKNS